MRNNTKKQIKLTELSKELGLSIATVSFVLNNQYKARKIPEITANRVREAASKHGYLPNISARFTRIGSSNKRPIVIAFITSLEAPLSLIGVTVKAFQKVSSEADFSHLNFTTIVEMFNAGQLKKLPGLFTNCQFNAAIITNTTSEDDAFLAQNIPPIPIVLIGREIPQYSSVREIPYNIGKEAAKILHSSKSKNIAFLRPNLENQTIIGRTKGFVDEVRELTGKKPVEILANGFNEREAFVAIMKFLKTGQKLDGLFTIMDDTLTTGAYHAIKKNGLKIPSDVTVIGSGDYPNAPYMDPPLSTFIGSQFDMQEEAVRLLLKQITGEIKQSTQLLISSIPILRESTQRNGQVPTKTIEFNT